MGKLRDLTGQKFGRLTVIERAEDELKINYRTLLGRHNKGETGDVLFRKVGS